MNLGILIHILFIISVALQIIAIIGLARRYNKKDNNLKVIWGMSISALSLSVFYYAAMHSESLGVAQVLYCISIIFYNAVIYFFFVFANFYTSLVKYAWSRNGIFIFGILQILDAISVFVSIFTKHVLYTDVLQLDATSYILVYEPGPFHIVHYIISIVTVLIGLIMLFIKAIKVPRSYKRRYINIALAVILMLLVNMLFHVFNADLDLSGIIIPLAIVIIYYYSVVFSPANILRQSRAMVIDEMHDGILIFDFEGQFRDGNKASRELLGYNNKNAHEVVEEWLKKNNIDILQEKTWEFTDKSLPGNPIIQISCVSYYENSKNKSYSGSYIRIHDRTEEILKNREDMYNATHDSLSGMLNRDAFIDEAQRFLENQDEIDHYLICSNIENFKLYNSLFGIEAGDSLLKNIGESLKSNVAGYNLIGRMEADRFCVLMPSEKFDEEIFHAAYATAIKKIDHMHYSVNMYLGVYAITDMDEPVSILYNRTLMAAQSIKGSAGSTFVAYYDKSITDRIISEQKQIGEIRRALENEEFEFFLQPQVDANGNVLGGEALARWNHPEKGVISPFFFIGLMEKYGMIAKLDIMVWEKVCRKLEEWKHKNITDQYISVNISAKDFYYMDIYEVFTDLIKKYDIDIKKLKLEITESAVMNNESEQIELIERLRTTGFIVEMDDFGSGYSSLNMLNKMHVDVLKLDMGFLQKNADIDRSRIIIKSVQGLAKSLNMLTVAEGVETKEQAEFLKSIGCDVLQGYLYSPPISVKEYEEKFVLQ